jgi:uncharacterized protein (TIGR02246 family)
MRIFVLFLLPLAIRAQVPKVDELAVRKVLTELADARNALDAKGVAEAFAANGAFTGTGSVAPIVGRAAIETAWARTFKANPQGQAIRTVEHIRFVSPTIAVADGTVRTTGFPSTGNPKLVDIWVLEKQAGAWKISQWWTCFADAPHQ